jgi:transcriptional regulator with XRE-family HTH domain
LEPGGTDSATSARLGRMAGGIPGLGERVRAAYQAAGFNRHSAALELGVAYSSLNNWENGKQTPDVASLVPMAAKFGVRIEWLLTGTGPQFVDPSLNVEENEADRERRERYTAAVEEYLASPLATGIGPRVVMLLRGFDFSTLGIDHPELRDVDRLRDLIESRRSVRQLSTHEPK